MRLTAFWGVSERVVAKPPLTPTWRLWGWKEMWVMRPMLSPEPGIPFPLLENNDSCFIGRPWISEATVKTKLRKLGLLPRWAELYCSICMEHREGQTEKSLSLFTSRLTGTNKELSLRAKFTSSTVQINLRK